ncbi:hypothetical protein AB0J84_04895 [Micromonospora arborensis]|uniref:hypothetical protein n=1 Tax=Micromonospora arborensis TaxID=2116518 RepID=UPI0034288818
MQEQPPSESTRREPAERARRRSPRATFTPPATAEQPTETAAPPAAVPASPRPRRAKAAPAVLFQPPEPDRPLPRQPSRPSTDPTGEQPSQPSSGQPSQPSSERPDPPIGDRPGPTARDQPGSPAATEGSSQPGPTAVEPAKARTTPVRKAAARKAAATSADVTPSTPAATPAPSPRKRAPGPTKRTAAARKSTTPRESAPEPVAQATPATAQVAPALGRTPESELRAVAARVLDHPGFAPELLALAAVRSLGPGAAEWAERLRARYPDASADGLARLATQRFVRSAGAGGATAALAGLFAPLAELASVLWTHANLVLHLAAAYGKDSADSARAVELLVLTQVHPDPASARAALAAAETAGDPVEGAWPRAAEAAWRLAAPLTAQAGGWVALRLVARLLPGAAVLAAALGDAAAADRLAARTVAAYRPSRALTGQSQSNHSRGSSA